MRTSPTSPFSRLTASHDALRASPPKGSNPVTSIVIMFSSPRWRQYTRTRPPTKRPLHGAGLQYHGMRLANETAESGGNDDDVSAYCSRDRSDSNPGQPAGHPSVHSTQGTGHRYREG